MRSCSRFLVIVLLVLSLPVQAFAAISMKYGTPGHPPESSQQMRQMPPMQHMASAHCHEVRDATLASDIDRRHQDPRSLHHAHTCSTCASCCFGAALPAAPVFTVPMAATAVTAVPCPGPVAVSFLTDGIERPPRPSLV